MYRHVKIMSARDIQTMLQNRLLGLYKVKSWNSLFGTRSLHNETKSHYVLSVKIKELSRNLSELTDKIEKLEKGRRLEVDNLYNNLLDRVIQLERKSYDDSLLLLNEDHTRIMERISLLEEQTEPSRKRTQNFLNLKRYLDYFVIGMFILVIAAAWSVIIVYMVGIVWEYVKDKNKS